MLLLLARLQEALNVSGLGWLFLFKIRYRPFLVVTLKKVTTRKNSNSAWGSLLYVRWTPRAMKK